MPEEMNNISGRIKILPEHIYQKIAAGEVIDRPSSALRELLDNAIDAGSSNIDVHLTEGGIREIRVIDNGYGMARDDLERCFLPHATSKIHNSEDLSHVTTLGFRGEALASIAASARLEIISAPKDDAGSGYSVYIDSGKLIKAGTAKSKDGTTVIVRDIFYSMPGRKQFLKQPSTEQKMCRRLFIEKVLPFTSVSFRLFTEGKKQFFLPGSSLRERCGLLFSNLLDVNNLLENSITEPEGLKIECILSYPEIYRRDRRYIYIYVNNRRIDEYSLIQAVEYGYGDFLPGGRFPYAFVILHVPPDTVDFNIHPSKREVRFKNLPVIHRFLHQFIRNTLLEKIGSGSISLQKKEYSLEPNRSIANSPRYELKYDTVHDSRPNFSISTFVPESSVEVNPSHGYEKIHYIGQVFTLFLIASINKTLYIIDQHAAHERYLYDRLVSEPPKSQRLLVPIIFEPEPEISEKIEQSIEIFSRAGITIEKTSTTKWTVSSLPSLPGISGDSILDILQTISFSEDMLQKELFAHLACMSSIQDGDVLDANTAVDLIRKAMILPEPRCPHGRPIWHTITRDELFSIMGRTV